MHDDSLGIFVDRMRSVWGPLTSELVDAARQHARDLLAAADSEPWLADLHGNRPANRELHRDPDHGFVLLAHTEHAGLYRPPHDHGRSWVMYAVQRGEIEMRTYARVASSDGAVRLVQRDAAVVRAGEVRIYLPGDVHDTRCVSEAALLYRFTERDLKVEDSVEHRVTRYAQQGGLWVPAAA